MTLIDDSLLIHQTATIFQDWMKRKGMRDETIRGYTIEVRQFHRFLSSYTNGPVFVSETSTMQIDAFIEHLIHVKKSAPKTINRKINAISAYFRSLQQAKIVTENPLDNYDRMKEPQQERIYLTGGEVDKIINVIEHPVANYFIKTMAYTGIRVRECIHLTLKDVDLKESVLKVIDGKGGKNRTLPINKRLQKELQTYLAHHRPKTDSLYFFALKKTGTISTQYINRILKEACEKAGIDKPVTSHTLRHSFASYLLKRNVNLAVIQKLLGHSNLQTTSVYLHVKQDELANAVDQIDY